MGAPSIAVLDHDVVESHNLASQLYRLEDVGKPKVRALAEIIAAFSDAAIDARHERYEGGRLSGIVIACVDDMDVRRLLWENAKFDPGVDLFIDTRMGGNVALMLSARPCDPDDVRHYEQHLFSSADASPLPCTSRAIAYNTFGVAAMVAALVRRWWTEGVAIPTLRMDFGSHVFMQDRL
jgi:hypothetical protein